MELEIKREQIIFTQDVLIDEMLDNQPYGYYNGDDYCDFSLFIKYGDTMFYCPVWEEGEEIVLFELENPYQGFYETMIIKNIVSGTEIGDLYNTLLDLGEQYGDCSKQNPIGYDFIKIESTKPNVMDIKGLEVEPFKEKQTEMHSFSWVSNK